MTLREKYGEWGIILGATEGVGKAFCERLAKEGMNVVMVGRREEKLKQNFCCNRKSGYGIYGLCSLLTLFWQNPGYTLGKA